MSFTRFDPAELATTQSFLLAGSEDNRDRMERLLNNLPKALEQELTERQRLILTMHYFHGMSVTEIAQELGISKSTVSRSISRAAERLFCALRYSL